MYESSAARLTAALTAAFGDEPQWELLPNRSHGYYLHYNDQGISMGAVRAVINATLDFSVGVILAPRGPRPAELPPIDGDSGHDAVQR